MSGAGANAFIQGLQGGMDHRAQSKRNKKIDRMLDAKGQTADLELWGQKDQMNRSAAERGMKLDWSQMAGESDPYDMSLKGMIGGLGRKLGIENDWGLEQPSGAFETPLHEGLTGGAAGIQESGARTYAIPGYGDDQVQPGVNFRDGGPVRKYADGGEVKPRKAGYYQDPKTGVEFIDGVPQGEVPMQGYPGKGALSIPGKIKGFAEDVGRNIGGNTRRRMEEWAPKGYESSYGAIDAEGATAKGHAMRRDAAEGARGLGQLGMGILEDTSIMPVIKGVGGFLGFGDDPADAPPESPATTVPGVPTDQAAAIGAAEVQGPSAPQVSSQGSQTDPPNQGPAQSAIPADQEAGPVQWANQPVVNPAEMPTYTTEDWVAYRSATATNMIARGASPDEAHEAITNMQHRGFMNNGLQALTLLASGDAPRATMALKAAYQYFPNGMDVKFGMTTDASGQPALVAMGQPEGDPDAPGAGKPMVLNQERLSKLIHNMKDPAAFTQWTKDWRDEQFQRQKHRDTTAINTANAETARINARSGETRAASGYLRAASSGSGGGYKISDAAAASESFDDLLRMEGLDREFEQGELLGLRAMMEQVWMAEQGEAGRGEVAQIVLNAVSGDEPSIAFLADNYGIQLPSAGE
jgi:hypothetical protein